MQLQLLNEQQLRWPQQGKVILAQYDDSSVTVYQAYCPSIGHYAARHGHFGGEFSFNRMSWIKPNFLWMMYRCGWGLKTSQEVVLAIKLKRSAFEYILANAVPSSFDSHAYPDQQSWQQVIANSDVRLQWDPDHGPLGEKLSRRAIQLGLRADVLMQYAHDWIIEINDISPLVAQLYQQVALGQLDALQTPLEQVYQVQNRQLVDSLGLDFG